MSGLRQAIGAARERLPLPGLLAHLDLEQHARKNARCPLHEDHAPSFSVFQGEHGWRWKCHAGCGEGDEIDFLEAWLKVSRGEAMRRFCAMAGTTGENIVGGNIQHPMKTAEVAGLENVTATGPRLPEDATPGAEADWRALAALRQLSPLATHLASLLGTLHFGTVCGFRCWIITDERRLCAEARRMDGERFPALGSLGERKAHTLKGSVKSWPVGLAVRRYALSEFRALLAVEGGPDYLAALHFSLAGDSACLPFAFLGAGTAGAIHPEARELLAGRRIRFYPHRDPAGRGAVEKWSRQLAEADCDLDAFDLADLHFADGRPVKDLNDCTQVPPERLATLETLLLP